MPLFLWRRLGSRIEIKDADRNDRKILVYPRRIILSNGQELLDPKAQVELGFIDRTRQFTIRRDELLSRDEL